VSQAAERELLLVERQAQRKGLQAQSEGGDLADAPADAPASADVSACADASASVTASMSADKTLSPISKSESGEQVLVPL
jgi:hypothetical protein